MMTDYLALAPQVAMQTVEGMAVMVLADSGEVLVLNPTGSRILELVDGKRSLAEIAGIIEAEYQVSLEEVRRDLEAFMQTLQEAGALITGDPCRR